MRIKLNTLFYGLLFSGLGTFSYMLLVNYTNLSREATETLYSVKAFLFFIVAFNILGYSTLRLSSWINNQYSRNIKKRGKIILLYTAVILMLFLLNYGLLVMAKLLVGAAHPYTFPNGGVRILIVVWLVELVILGLLLANNSIKHSLKLEQQAAELQKENNTARYTALQNQLNPHFLFNSLNTLIAEIQYDPQKAVGFTKNLSNVYRYVLQCQNKPLVTLGEELEFIRAYLFLHEVRLGNCIHWQSDIPSDHLDCMLPPLTLQLLVENVIKHNSITVNKPMKIAIGIVDGYLVVSNSISPKKRSDPSGIGLKNLSNRCKLILNREINVSGENGLFTVKVPLLYE